MRAVLIFAVITLAFVTLAICGLVGIARQQWLDSGTQPLDSPDEVDSQIFPTEHAATDRSPQAMDET